jgi:hypothetical protein
MWDKIVKYQQLFPDAVLTGVDAQGYPLSVRCQPVPDTVTHVLRMHVPADSEMQSGPGTLLYHSHDEKLWKLKSFAVCGTLELDGDDWILHPLRFLPGMGIQGLLGTIRMLIRSPGVARRYLQKRSLAQPVIDWDKLKTL